MFTLNNSGGLREAIPLKISEVLNRAMAHRQDFGYRHCHIHCLCHYYQQLPNVKGWGRQALEKWTLPRNKVDREISIAWLLDGYLKERSAPSYVFMLKYSYVPRKPPPNHCGASRAYSSNPFVRAITTRRRVRVLTCRECLTPCWNDICEPAVLMVFTAVPRSKPARTWMYSVSYSVFLISWSRLFISGVFTWLIKYHTACGNELTAVWHKVDLINFVSCTVIKYLWRTDLL